MKLKWYVDPQPTGRYRSFEKRQWPYAEYPLERPAAFISCVDEYIPANVKSGNHSELIIRVAVYQFEGNGFDWRTLKQRAKTLKEAKEIAQSTIDTNKHWWPVDLRPENNS